MQILPRIGLDDLRLGMARDAVRVQLGEPEEVSTYAIVEGEPDETEAWYYWSLGLSAHFDSELDWRLSTLELSNSEAQLAGKRLIGLGVEEVRSALEGVALASGHVAELVTEPSMSDDDWSELIAIEQWSVNLWFEDGVLDSIQWGVPLDEDEQECWPQQG